MVVGVNASFGSTHLHGISLNVHLLDYSGVGDLLLSLLSGVVRFRLIPLLNDSFLLDDWLSLRFFHK
jgi:hypothetical protein